MEKLKEGEERQDRLQQKLRQPKDKGLVGYAMNLDTHEQHAPRAIRQDCLRNDDREKNRSLNLNQGYIFGCHLNLVASLNYQAVFYMYRKDFS